jgi:hypothetical protein
MCATPMALAAAPEQISLPAVIDPYVAGEGRGSVEETAGIVQTVASTTLCSFMLVLAQGSSAATVWPQ